ncbi:uncharacterized protein PV09_00105 [Verruconis gallopava]|uniref:Uncharacterized protein n=1 Tax=Verruconis gallopava TaxID=253628 RepID=A0A0D2BCQ2_9PEZI|nr:uncharacterized protein PV09_00105 [Verruconis gallopava]KIW09174.1 hypothetical protein PV09_00105 [Verruconis gallopava]
MSGNRQRSLIYAIGAAAVVMVGAYSGANLKTDSEKKQLRQEFLAETNEQKIARLEAQKAVWMRHRDELIKKIEQIDAGATNTTGERTKGP